METQRKKQIETSKNVFTMTSGGFVIAVGNNAFINSKKEFFRPSLVTILKALHRVNVTMCNDYLLHLQKSFIQMHSSRYVLF